MSLVELTIADGVAIHKLQPDPEQLKLLVINRRDVPIALTLDINGSTGVLIQQSRLSSSRTVEVLSKSEAELATLELTQPWKLTAKYKVTLRHENTEKFLNQVRAESRVISGLLNECRRLVQMHSLAGLTPDNLSQLANFVDPTFPPFEEAVFRGYETVGLPATPHWRRPAQFLSENFQLFGEVITPYDVKSGVLEDLWLIGAFSAVAEQPPLLQRLFQKTPSKVECGLYQIELCRGGQWVTVTVDDYCPCFPNFSPMFSRCHGEELWVLLLEKAFAKLEGSYLRLREVPLRKALSTLTGFPVRTLNFADTQSAEEIWDLLFTAYNSNYLSVAATDKYTYVVLSVHNTAQGRLVQMRNIWGNQPWLGEWRAGSAKWTVELSDEVGYDPENHTLWMSFEEFHRNHTSLTICCTQALYEARLRGKFLRADSAEGRSLVLSKFYYCLHVSEVTQLQLSLFQEATPLLDLGFFLFQREPTGPKLHSTCPAKEDEHIMWSVEVAPGDYIVLPWTSGCALQPPLYVKPSPKALLTSGSELTPEAERALKEVFRKFDLMMAGDLSEFDLRALFETGGWTLSKAEFETLQENFSSSRTGLTEEGFLAVVKQRAEQNGERYFWDFLLKLGYDPELYSNKARGFVLTLHSDKQMQIQVRDNLHSHLDARGLVELVRQQGEVKHESPLGDFYAFRQGSIGTYLVQNKTDAPLLVSVDVSGAQNVLISTLRDVNRLHLEGGEAGVVLHFQLLPGSSDFRPRIEMIPVGRQV